MKNYIDYLKSITTFFTAFFGRKLKIISTFNGIGAATEELKQLGINFDMHTVCEIEKNANNTYYKNNEKTNHIDDIRELLKTIAKGLKLDVLIQTPPCQSFSMAGLRKGLESLNGNLFFTAIKLQLKVDSNIVIYENVSGLISHHKTHYTYKDKNGNKVEFTTKPKKETIKKDGLKLVKTEDLSCASLINEEYNGAKKSIGHTLHRIEELLLEDTRYNYYWKVINSCDNGLPQNRQRIFIVGIKKELDKGFTFPENKDLKYTVADILESNPVNNVFYKNEAGHILNPTNQKRRPNRIHTYAKYDKTMSYEATRRVSYPYVSPCITTGNNCKFFIDNEVRVLTPTELKRVHGFREEFEFVGSVTQQHKQLGNTVSPGVYVNLFDSIFNSVEFVKPSNNEDYKNEKSTSKINRRKTRPTHNDHISISKKVSNESDSNYIYLTKDTFNEYESFLSNGGTITVTLEVYKKPKKNKKTKTVSKKATKKLDCKKIISVNSLKLLGLTNKKYEFYRVRVSGDINTVEKVGKRDVINARNGGKNQFEVQTNYGVEQLNTKNHKTVVDGFCGAGGFTLKNIEKMKFKSYIMNEWDFYQHNVFLGVKKNPAKVIEVFEKYNNEYLSLINDKHLAYEKEYVKNKYKSKSKEYYHRKELRLKNSRLKKYYEKTVHMLEDKTQDIYTLAGLYIFVMNRTFNGIFEYKNIEQTIIDETSYNWHLNPKEKVKMIKHWSYILNKYNVELTNEDIFELVKRLDSDSTLYLDPVYLNSGKGADYGCSWSSAKQLQLLEDTSRYKRVLYSNENCQELYDLGIDKYFNDYITFKRQNKLGRVDKAVGGEFLGFRNRPIKTNTQLTNLNISNISMNNTNYNSGEDLDTLVS